MTFDLSLLPIIVEEMRYNKKVRTLPNQLAKLFWDTDFKTIDVDKHQGYIIGRILHLGDESALKWLKQTYPKDSLMRSLHTCRELSDKDKNFYNLVY